MHLPGFLRQTLVIQAGAAAPDIFENVLDDVWGYGTGMETSAILSPHRGKWVFTSQIDGFVSASRWSLISATFTFYSSFA